MKKLFAIVLSVVMFVAMLSFAGCGSNDDNGDTVTIRVDLHGWRPTEFSESTATSKAYNSPKYIAAAFEELHEGKVKIEWVREKNLLMSREDVSNWFTMSTMTQNCPAIAFTWGTTFQDRGWYVDLTEYLEETNSYETAPDLAGKKWKESFAEYLWDLDAIRTYDDKIVAIPIALFAGASSAVMYNTETMPNGQNGDIGIEEEFSWQDYVDTVKDIMEDDPQNLVDGENYPIGAASWLMQFNLGPAYKSAAWNYLDPDLNRTMDIDGDGKISGQETLQGVVDGFFNPVTKNYARELFMKIKEYAGLLTDVNKDSSKWDAGTGVLKYTGSWVYTPEVETNRGFEWKMVPTPVEDSSEFTKDYVTWGTFEEAKPGVDLYLNIMRAGVTKNGRFDGEIDNDKLYYAVEFLKYLTTRAANNSMIRESNTSIGAVKGTDLPAWLTVEDCTYADCKFAQTEAVDSWPTGFVTEVTSQMDTIISRWISGNLEDDEFFKQWNDLQVEGARTMASSLGITLE